MQPTILVVDDSPVTRDICRRALAEQYRVLDVAGGDEALALLLNERPDLILLDIQLEGMDGFEVLERMRQMPDIAQTPVLLLTVKADIRDKQRGFGMGARDYITKPFDRLELVARVEARLREREMEVQRIENAMLEARNKAVSQLLITLSHHINNALAVLVGNIQLVDENNPAGVKKFLVQAKLQSERIRAVIMVLQDAVRTMNLKTMDDIGRKDFLFDIREEMQKRLADLQRAIDDPANDWK